MRLLIISAFVLLGGVAMATELAVPKKSAPPRAAESKEACLAKVAAECEAKNWTKLGKRACLRFKSRRCR